MGGVTYTSVNFVMESKLQLLYSRASLNDDNFSIIEVFIKKYSNYRGNNVEMKGI